MKKIFPSIVVVLTLFSCGPTEETQLTYEELVAEGWTFFQGASYDSALSRFTAASLLDPSTAEAFSGIGWSQLRKDQLAPAAAAFQTGSSQFSASATLFAGWSFVLNAQKFYASSNTQADAALLLDANWAFEHSLSYDRDHLHVLKAENYFALGNYASSLASVQAVNSSFSTNVSTSSGQAALAAEIERLKGLL